MWNKKHFSSIFKGFQLSKIVSDLRVRLKFCGIKYSYTCICFLDKFSLWSNGFYFISLAIIISVTSWLEDCVKIIVSCTISVTQKFSAKYSTFRKYVGTLCQSKMSFLKYHPKIEAWKINIVFRVIRINNLGKQLFWSHCFQRSLGCFSMWKSNQIDKANDVT